MTEAEAIARVAELEAAIQSHRDDMQGHRDYVALDAIDLALWRTLVKEK